MHIVRVRTTLAAAAAALIAACAFAAPAQAQFTTVGPEESAVMTPAPEVALPRVVYEAAGAYQRYMTDAARLSPTFGDGAAVASAVRAGAAYEPGQLTRGAVAYAAVIALQDPTFVRRVRGRGMDTAARKELAARIWRDPASVAQLGGAETAAGLIVSAVSDEGARLRGIGDRIKQAAYDVQLQSWSKREVAGREQRLAEVKLLSRTAIAGAPADVERMRQSVLGGAPLRLPAAAAPIYSPVVQRGLAIAALAALGEAGENDAEALEGLLAEPECASCLKMAKLNLFQCLAVSKPWYEDIYCLGQHGVKDTGDCLAETTSTPWRPTAVAAAAPAAQERRAYAAPAPAAQERRAYAAPAPAAQERRAYAAPAPAAQERRAYAAPAPAAQERRAYAAPAPAAQERRAYAAPAPAAQERRAYAAPARQEPYPYARPSAPVAARSAASAAPPRSWNETMEAWRRPDAWSRN